ASVNSELNHCTLLEVNVYREKVYIFSFVARNILAVDRSERFGVIILSGRTSPRNSRPPRSFNSTSDDPIWNGASKKRTAAIASIAILTLQEIEQEFRLILNLNKADSTRNEFMEDFQENTLIQLGLNQEMQQECVLIRKTGDYERPFSAPISGSRPLIISMPNNSSRLLMIHSKATTKLYRDIWPVTATVTNAPIPPFIEALTKFAGWPSTSAEQPTLLPGVGYTFLRVPQSDEFGYLGMRKENNIGLQQSSHIDQRSSENRFTTRNSVGRTTQKKQDNEKLTSITQQAPWAKDDDQDTHKYANSINGSSQSC
ncbi:16170_t:CDS:2, partial [Funneliformis geosporum]